MDNRVGDNVPSDKTLAELLTQLVSVGEQLKAFCLTLTPEERRQILHPRTGGALMVEKAGALASKYKISVRNVPLDGMTADLRLASALGAFVAEARLISRLVEDTQSEAENEYWQAFLAIYGALQRASQHDPTLAVEMTELTEFMAAHGRRKKAPAARVEQGTGAAKGSTPA